MKKVFSDNWYGNLSDAGIVSFEDFIEKWPDWFQFFVKKFSFIRGGVEFLTSFNYPLVITDIARPGIWFFLLLEFLFNKRKNRIILMEFIRSEKPSGLIRGSIYQLKMILIERPIFQRTLKYAFVLTGWEKPYYAKMFDIPEENFIFIPWAGRRTDSIFPGQKPDSENHKHIVLMSGRSACDWETLFLAFQEQNWDLIVICGSRDLKIVKKLNKKGRAKVFCDISEEEHIRFLHESTVYALCLKEKNISSGQIRIMEAVSAGVPIVATAVKGIEGYLINQVTGILVAPGNYLNLRNSINGLLNDSDFRNQLSQNAFDRASNWTMNQYKRAISDSIFKIINETEVTEIKVHHSEKTAI